jgi:hypothetical protein
MRSRLIVGPMALSVATLAVAQAPESVIRDVQQSHVEGDVPAPRDFDSFLQRDVAAYFRSAKGIKNPEVALELLRNGATQSGVAFPKFYAWVVVRNEGQAVAEGALRLAAIDRVRFEVTDFLSKGDINSTPAAVSAVFPAPLVAGILERAAVSVPPNTSLERTRER